MSDHVEDGDEHRAVDTAQLPQGTDPRDDIEAYDTDDGVVFYDARNPLAWLKATKAIDLEQQL